MSATGPGLTPNEIQALTLYASGFTAYQTARRMGVKPSTVNEYLKRIRAKYAAVGRDASCKVELRNRAIEDHHIDARDCLAFSASAGLLGPGAWSPATSPTARKLRILYRPTGSLRTP